MEMIMSTHLGLWVCREMSHASFDNQNRPPERERFYPNIILLCTLGQKLKSLLDNAPNCLLSWVRYPKYKLFQIRMKLDIKLFVNCEFAPVCIFWSPSYM